MVYIHFPKQEDVTIEELARTEVENICCILCQECLNIQPWREIKSKSEPSLKPVTKVLWNSRGPDYTCAVLAL